MTEAAYERDLLSRLAALEGRNRRLEWSVGVLGAALLLMITAAFKAPTSRVVEAEEFRLVGPDGRNGGSLAFDSSGAKLLLHDGTGGIRIGLLAGSRGSLLILRDGEVARLMLSAASQREAALALYAADGSQRLGLAQDDSTASVSLFAAGLRKRGSIRAGPTGTAVVLLDERAEPRSVLAADVKAGGSLLLLDAYGRPKH